MTDDLTLDDLPQPEYEGTVPVDELDTDGENPNEMSDSQFGLLCDRMRKEGWLGGPILTNTDGLIADGLIADGEHRWRAAQDIGLSEVPVKQFNISDEERRLWRQEMNKNQGEHDPKRDALEYDYLLDNGMAEEVHDLTSAAEEDLDELLAEIKVSAESPVDYEYDPDHNVYFEDCVEGLQEHVADGSVDCIVTDPPYGMGFHADRTGDQEYGDRVKDWGGIDGDQSIEDAVELLDGTLQEATRTISEGGHVYIFCDWRGVDKIKPLVEKHLNVKNILVWDKGSMGIGDLTNNWGYSHEFVIFATKGERANELSDATRNVLEHGRITRTDYEHPTQKPEPLLSQLIRTSTNEGDTVLDPFMGSGTTAVAAIQNNRDYVGFELDEENYRSVIEKRISEAKRQMESSQNSDGTPESAADD